MSDTIPANFCQSTESATNNQRTAANDYIFYNVFYCPIVSAPKFPTYFRQFFRQLFKIFTVKKTNESSFPFFCCNKNQTICNTSRDETPLRSKLMINQ